MNKAKRFIKKIEEQLSLCAANCQSFNEEDCVCITGAVKAMIAPGKECPFVSKFDSHQTSCPHYVPKGGSPDRRFFR